jgi:hypothetical protein
MRPRLEQLEDRSLPSSFTAATVSDLIADINAANLAGGTNTITLTAPTTSPYVLTAVDNTTDGPTGLPVITGRSKPDTLTIIGNGDTIERSTASGTPAFRLFDVASGASLTLQNLTLQNGLAFGSGSSAEGGAIFNQGTLVLSSVTAQGNVAQGSCGTTGTATKRHQSGGSGGNGQDAAGGAIWSNFALTLENGTLVQNNLALAGDGGDAYPAGFNAFGGDGGNAYGGGVYIGGGTAGLADGSLSGNNADGGYGGTGGQDGLGGYINNGRAGGAVGGGLDAASGTVQITNVSVLNNHADQHVPCGGGYRAASDGQGAGGGIAIFGTGTLSNDTIELNSANVGGGIVIGGTVTLSNDTVESNTATYDGFGGGGGLGGGILIGGSGTVTLCNDTVQNNSAGEFGGGIYIYSYFTNLYIDSFTVAHTINNTDSSGTKGSTANIDGTYILNNC